MFQQVDAAPGDPILSLMEEFKTDTRAGKVNLGIGLYYDEAGHVPQFRSVREARRRLDQYIETPDLYLPMEGYHPYRQVVQSLLFGDKSVAVQERRIATVQSLGGSGALKIGADFLQHYYPDSEVWVSDPTWENHLSIFNGAGFATHRYPYINMSTGGVDYEAMLTYLQTLPAKSIVLLHPCCHNPTGADLSPQQWDEVIKVFVEHDLIAFFDIAYQGLGAGLDEDTYAIKAAVEAGLECLVSHSFSKIFSLYGDRIGALSVVCADQPIAANVLSQLKRTVRRNYSSPPVRGAQIVAEILQDNTLRSQWRDEVEKMRLRIIEMRGKLAASLKERVPGYNVHYLTQQRGMFSYTGFSAEHVDQIRKEFGVYLVQSGRVCMAGLNDQNIMSVVEAFSAILAP